MLSNGEPLPIITGRPVQVCDGSLLEEAQNVPLTLGL